MNGQTCGFTNYYSGKLAKCRAACRDKACEFVSMVNLGCGQMYSCSHGCIMRNLGLDETTCKSNCNRNGESGCTPEVEGYQFKLCQDDCQRVPETPTCPKHPTVAECELGCTIYDNKTSGK